MARYSAVFVTTFLGLACFWSAINAEGISWEEKFEKIIANYETLTWKLESLERINGILNAKVSHLEELELKYQQRQSLLNELQQSFRSMESVARQAPVSAMPRSCEDLRARGHLASGLYMVMGNRSVDTVYCDFCQPKNSSGYQTLIGLTDVKSAPTYFNVQKNAGGFNQLNVPISYDIETLNIGGAMNLQTGIFTAPRAGKYVFSFTGVAYFPAESSTRQYVYVGLYKNYSILGRGFSDEISAAAEYGTFSMQSTLNLKMGDRVWCQIDSLSAGVTLTGTGYTHFNGLLLEEEISS